MVHRHFLTIVLGLGLATAGAGRNALTSAEPADTKARPVSYKEDVRPLLQAKCVRCHTGKAAKGELDLNTPASILKGGLSGPAVEAGKPDDSPLYEKVRKGLMPPPAKNEPLGPAEVETLRRWIMAGARFDGPDGAKSEPVAVMLTQHDVLPIVQRRCTACHGVRRQEGGLDLHTRAAMLRGGKSGPAVVPGKPDDSLMLKRASLGQMPPPEKLVEGSVKPIEKAELDVLVKWVAAGAPEATSEPDVATTTPDPLVTDKDRDFWSFRPPGAVKVPTVQQAARVRNPIDAFVLQKLEAKGLSLAPEADRLTLLRRASFDLTGLPPEPDEVRAYLADAAPDAYEQVIDRLLASPRYGVRWGRYWLDVAGYADSEGKREQDLPRPHAYRYRDYVVQSFNADKPYDRFLMEQIAGDELADYESAPTIAPELYDNLVATGFLRMAPDATWANITGYAPDRIEVIADELDVLGSAVLGLTMKCARCHDHKYDPIPQRDYYRLTAVFKGAFDEYDWLKPDIRPGIGPVSSDVVGPRLLPYVTTAERKAWETHNAKLQEEINKLQAARDGKAPDTAARIKELQARRKPEPKIHALWDRGEPSPTYLYRRGNSESPGRLVGPGVPSVLTDGKTPFEVKPPWPGAQKTGRRLAFARWLVAPDQPLTSRVLVNRVWKQHFGKGIVKTLDNFGKNGTPPTHPELLDWLAREFVRQGWSVKALHRLLMTSSTYRQSSVVTPERGKIDPENGLYSRMPLVRLDAEALYDTLLLTAGRLDETRFGPADAIHVRADGLITPAGTERGWRRLLYVQHTRKQLPTHLENFDYPQMNPNCVERRDSIVAPQALQMMNSGMVHDLAGHFARRVVLKAGSDPAKQIELVYLIGMSRPPCDEEKRVGLDALAKLIDKWTTPTTDTGKPDQETAGLKALATYCHAIMNSAGFLYVD